MSNRWGILRMGGADDARDGGDRATAPSGRRGSLDVPGGGWCLGVVDRRHTTPLWIALALLGCKDAGEAIPSGDEKQPPSVTRLDVRDRTPKSRHPAPGVSATRLQELVRATLRANTNFDVPEVDAKPDRSDERATYRASVEISLSRQAAPAAIASGGIGLAHVYIQMDRISGGAGIESHGAEATSDKPVPPTGPGAGAAAGAPGQAPPAGAAGGQQFWLNLIKAATAEAFHVVVVQVDARKREATALQYDLASKDVAVRQEAVRELGRRGEVAALDAIASLLDDPHQDVVLASVGALTNLRDQKAATPLIASTRGRSNEYLAAVIGALRTIGGVESEAYLDALATGHPSDDIKARATQALLDVRAQRKRPRRMP